MPQYKAIPVATARPAAPIQFTPAQDQSTVGHLRVTIKAIKPLPDGGLYMVIVCGELGFRLQVPALPGRPDFQVGQRYMLEYPKGQNPLVCQYTAIYPADQKPADTGGHSMNTLTPKTTLAPVAPTVTMSSLELVDYINSTRQEGEPKLAHSDFLKKVPAVLGAEVAGNFSCYYTAANGKRNPCYRFPKREACLMAMSYSYELQAKVYDRMTELEAQAAKPAHPALPDFTNPAEAARAWAVQFEQREQLAHEVKTLTPKAAALDRITATEGSLCVTDAAKVLGMQPKALFKWLHEHQWIYRRAGNSHWIGYQHRLQTGVLEQKATIVTKSDGTEKTIEQVLVTAKGLARLSELMGGQA